MKRIPLTQGKFAIVDDEDYEGLMQWKWYAQRNRPARLENNKTVFMYRVINKTPDGMYTDHINGNPLDNQKINLRSVTYVQNSVNRKGRTNTFSKYKGVYWCKKRKKWVARLISNKKTIFFSRFKSEILAAKAYNKAAIELHGEYARLNVIPSSTQSNRPSEQRDMLSCV